MPTFVDGSLRGRDRAFSCHITQGPVPACRRRRPPFLVVDLDLASKAGSSELTQLLRHANEIQHDPVVVINAVDDRVLGGPDLIPAITQPVDGALYGLDRETTRPDEPLRRVGRGLEI